MDLLVNKFMCCLETKYHNLTDSPKSRNVEDKWVQTSIHKGIEILVSQDSESNHTCQKLIFCNLISSMLLMERKMHN